MHIPFHQIKPVCKLYWLLKVSLVYVQTCEQSRLSFSNPAKMSHVHDTCALVAERLSDWELAYLQNPLVAIVQSMSLPLLAYQRTASW